VVDEDSLAKEHRVPGQVQFCDNASIFAILMYQGIKLASKTRQIVILEILNSSFHVAETTQDC